MKITEEVQMLLARADHAIEVARVLEEKGYHADAASKTYYAMFYSAQALLKAEGVDVVKHSAVESALGYHFAKTGRLNPEFHRMLLNSRKIRETADYDLHEEIIEPVARVEIKNGVSFVAEMKRLISI
ncbi:MAG: HEPN domain-containing protein [Fibrobacterota bacterium]